MSVNFSHTDASMHIWSEEECRAALFQIKWSDGFRCDYCNHSDYYTIRTRRQPLFQCKSCGHQTSLTVNTVMEGSRLSLQLWFQAMYYMKAGISATKLASLLGVTYKTAWLLNHKLRYAIQNSSSNNRLEGLVRVTGAFYAKPEYHGSVYLAEREQPVLAGGSLQEDGTIERIKFHHIDRRYLQYRQFVNTMALPLARQHLANEKSDVTLYLISGKTSYRPLSNVVQAAFKWISKTFQGIGPKYLQRYLDEYAFRYCSADQQFTLPYLLLEECCKQVAITYNQLIGRVRKRYSLANVA